MVYIGERGKWIGLMSATDTLTGKSCMPSIHHPPLEYELHCVSNVWKHYNLCDAIIRKTFEVSKSGQPQKFVQVCLKLCNLYSNFLGFHDCSINYAGGGTNVRCCAIRACTFISLVAWFLEHQRKVPPAVCFPVL